MATDKQGKHSTSVKQDGVEVQNFGFVPVNNAEHCTLGEMSNSGDKFCNDSDNSTQPLQITQDHKQTNKHKEQQKFDDFLWTQHFIQKSQCAHLRTHLFWYI